VTAVFETEVLGKVTLRRSVILDTPKEHRVISAVSACGSPLKTLPESKYASWIERVIGWKADDVILSQFGFIEQFSVAKLLARLPKALDQLQEDADVRPPMLKRRSIAGQPSTVASRVTAIRTTAEAWAGRRLDEIYRELSREPLDEHYETWSDGGQACLRRLQDGSFTIWVSRQRGLAALGKGVPLESLSDGDRDLCALALLLTLPGLKNGSAGLQDSLPPVVILDEPDSRLDKRGAMCLRRFLSGIAQPAFCLLTSLNNHKAFTDLKDAVVLPELADTPLPPGDGDGDEEDPYGDVRPHRRSCSTSTLESQ